ncbi:MAG: class I SAM-dependent methyltransferase [Bacteroidota bacterium]
MSTLKQEIHALHESELYLHFFGDALGPERTKRECDYIETLSDLSGGKVLDLACGHGRHSIELTKRGYQLEGIDINTGFLEIARQEAKAQQLHIPFIEGDLLKHAYPPAFDLAILLFNTLGFFNSEDAQQVFHQIDRALKPGGKAIIDTKNRDHLIQEIQPYAVHEVGNDLMIDRLRFDPITGTTTNNRTYIKAGIRYDTPFTMYAYNYADLKRFASKTNLTITQVLGGWKGEPFDSASRRIMLVLEKR